MNRVLRRPMFRTGGVAEGITSGLDQTKLTASRPMYNRGRVVRPGGYKGEKEEYERMNKILQDIRGPQESRFPEFLTSMGLDLLTRPKSGNIFQQVAASAKGPYSEWMGARAASRAEEDKLSAALLGDVMVTQAKKEMQTEELKSKEKIAAMGEKDKTYQFEKKQEALGHLIDTQYKLEDELIEIQNKFHTGTDQTPLNFMLQNNNIETKILPYEFNMTDMPRKEILNNNLIMTNIGWVYHFNCIPNNEENKATYYWMEKTYKHLYEN